MPKLIHGVSFDISAPYAEGHTLNAAEAKVLNQTRSENIGNNLRTAVKEAVDSGDPAKLDEVRAALADYDAKYTFTMANVSASRKLDPIEREARAIAKDWVKNKLAEKGEKFSVPRSGYDDESWAEYIDTKIDEVAGNPAVLKEAKKRVDAKQKFSAGVEAEI